MNTNNRLSDVFQKVLHSCALDETSFSIGRVNCEAPVVILLHYFMSQMPINGLMVRCLCVVLYLPSLVNLLISW